MIFRKILAIVLATVISFSIITVFVLGESIVETLTISILMFSPVILLYGVPVTLLSDYFTRQFLGKKRAILALTFHLFFGVSFPVIFRVFDLSSNAETELLIIASTTTSILIWIFDELLRFLIPETRFY